MQSANGWEKAQYDDAFEVKLGLVTPDAAPPVASPEAEPTDET
jgi:hypothetical protein